MRALILYYSISNNTKWLGIKAQEALTSKSWESDIFHLRDFNSKKYPYNPDLIILGVPVHYWDIPNPAIEKIRSLPRFNETAAFVFSSFGRCVCNSVPFLLAKELVEKNCRILGGGQIVSPHSAKVEGGQRLGDLEMEFGKGQPNDIALGEFVSVIKRLAEEIETNKAVQIDLKELKKLHTKGIVASLMSYLTSDRQRMRSMPHIEYAKENCEYCYKCIKSCDAGAIKCTSLKEIVINKKMCNKCYKCTDICPSGALTTNWNKVIFGTKVIHIFAKDVTTKFVPLAVKDAAVTCDSHY